MNPNYLIVLPYRISRHILQRWSICECRINYDSENPDKRFYIIWHRKPWDGAGWTCLEASFCGVSVAIFNTIGISDIVEHKKNGYLAKPFEAEDLYQDILYCLENQETLSRNSLTKVRQDFNNKNIVDKHISLYKSVLK